MTSNNTVYNSTVIYTNNGTSWSIKYTKNDPAGQAPERAHPSDAGADLRTIENVTLAPGTSAMVDTGISIAIPDGYAGFVCPRSGLAAKYGITVTNSPGIIDSSYRGPIKVILHNLGEETWKAEVGERIAQLLIVRTEIVPFTEVDTLDSTKRGEGGFGSTGVS